MISFFFFKNKKIMIFRKVKKTQHPNLKFGHTWGEIPKKTHKKKKH